MARKHLKPAREYRRLFFWTGLTTGIGAVPIFIGTSGDRPLRVAVISTLLGVFAGTVYVVTDVTNDLCRRD